MARRTFTDSRGQQWVSTRARPYYVRCGRPRHFGSLKAARAHARRFDFYSTFFEYAAGTGCFVEGS